MTEETSAVDEISAVSDKQRQVLMALHVAAVDLVNSKISDDLRGTDFDTALKTGRASIRLTIDLPRGEIACTAHYPAMTSAPLLLFDVRLTPASKDLRP